MAELAVAAAYRALVAKLRADGLTAYADQALAGVPRPHYLIWWQGGGEANRVRAKDANLVFGIKCVADSMTEALAGAVRMAGLLNDKGVQDVSAGALDASPTWLIATSTQEGAIHAVENVDNARQIYHEGFQLRLIMHEVT